MLSSTSIEDRYALSPMQQGMLFHCLYEQHAGLYVDHAIFDLPGHELNVVAFRRAWETVVARHASLRTSFHWEGVDAPVQCVHASVDLPFRVEDWRGLSPAEQDERLEAYVRSDRARGFTLSEAPLTRLAVFTIGEAHSKCAWTIHHLLADGRSALVIIREVLALYDAFSIGSQLHLPPPRRYREYIDWLERQDRRAAETFWRRTLHGFTAPTPLVVERPSDARRTSAQDGSPIESDIRVQEICLPSGTAATLQELGSRHLLSLNTFVQGAWALLLSRYSGEEDVVFGEVRAGRRATVEDANAIVGVFMNTIAVRARVPADTLVIPWLKGLRLQQVPVLKYEHTPLVDVQRWSEVPRGTPLFDSILDFTDFSLGGALRGLGRHWREGSLQIREKTNYALMVYAAADPELRLKIGYDPRRFDDDTVRGMLGHLATLLAGMAADPNRRVRDLPLLTEAEQHRLLVEWNNTAADYPRQACVHELFEAQAARTPDAPAVYFEDRELTYRGLNARANQLARYLANAGVRPGARIGICLERSLDMMVALLGVLKAGAAYVPLDPSYPKQRLTLILNDAGVEVLVTEQRLARTLGPVNALAICLDTDWPALSQERDENLGIEISSDDLAYVMYTSGSTGTPKGVRVRHRNVVNFLAAMDDSVGTGRPAVWLAVTSISFDISVLELFWPLSRGFKVILQRNDETGLGAGRYRDYSIPAQIAAHRVTHFQCTPSMARMLAMRPDSLAALKPLRKMLLGGEAFPESLATQLAGVVSGDVLNMYGPTETTVWSTTAVVNGHERPVPIGRPIANTHIYILDRLRRPVPVGVPGELFIGGDGVAAGYHNRPDLTVDRFVDNPFSTSAGRLYRTGDVARYRPDGAIEFLGRVDHQIKIRGHRIELGEIEAVLQQYPGIREAVVVAREDQPGDQRLVAYTTSDRKEAPGPDDLRAHLKAKLPKEMVPSSFVALDVLPRTPNGKLDRRALPAPDRVRSETETAFVAPRNPVERELTRLWEKTLGVRPIGLTDNFFELGGHSLLAVSLFAQIEKTFGRNLPLATLFQGPTIEQLARILQHDEPLRAWSPLVPIQPHGSKRPLFFMHAEGGNVLEYYPLARSLGPDQPFYALQSEMLNGHGAGPAPRLEDMVARYVREIRAVQPTGPYLIGGWCLGGYLAYETVQQLRAQGERVALMAMIQTAAPDYPRLRPDVTYLQRVFYRTIKRLDLEWSNVKALPPKARVGHLGARARRLLTIIQLKVERLIDPWLARCGLADRHSLAHKLEAIGKLHVRAAMSYTFRPYTGESVTLFRASRQPLGIVPDQTMGWGTLLNGKLEVHDVHAHHQNILIEPAVRSLATQLTACIERACENADVSALAGKRAS